MADVGDIGRVEPRLDANHANLTNLTWRLWVADHPIAAALLSGFVATIIGYFFGGVGLPQFIWPIVNGHVVLPGASPTAQFWIGEVFIHGMDGVVFTLIYAVVMFPMFSALFGHQVNPATNMAEVLLFGIILATISAGFLTPYVYEAGADAGIFSTGLGWKVPLAIYLWHTAYAVNLGLMCNPMAKHQPSRAETASVQPLHQHAPDTGGEPLPAGSSSAGA